MSIVLLLCRYLSHGMVSINLHTLEHYISCGVITRTAIYPFIQDYSWLLRICHLHSLHFLEQF